MEINRNEFKSINVFYSRMGGAQHLAYPPVIAGGARANTIHYISNNQLINDGEMVLMDAGIESNNTVFLYLT
jgi:Xaa-Pro aminopeptidase